VAHWQTFTIPAVQRVFLPVLAFVLLYGLRVLCGITSTNALSSLLFSNVPVMLLIGFTVAEVSGADSPQGQPAHGRRRV
jgi:hypothetical protein